MSTTISLVPVQPFPRPSTIAEYLELRPRMIDTHGKPLVLAACPRCAHPHFTVEPCAHEAPCPYCGATGARCRRPSGHDAAAWHDARRAAFEALCAMREAQGLPQVARWPETPADTGTQPTLFELDCAV
jgi:hypothetical protein